MSSFSKTSLLSTSLLGSKMSSGLAFMGVPSLIWGAFNCYFGFKILKFIIAFNTACMFGFIGILLGLLFKSTSIGVVATVLGFIAGAFYGYKFYKFMVTVNFSFTVGAIVGGISGIITESIWIGVFILFVVAVATFLLVYKIYDILMILYTAISGAFSIGTGLMFVTQNLAISIVAMVFCAITGFKYQSNALKNNPQNAPNINQSTNSDTDDTSYDPSKPLLSPQAQAKIDALFDKIKPIVLMLLNKKIELPKNLMYYFLAGSILSLISLLLAFDQGLSGLTLFMYLSLTLTLCLIFGKYISTKITDIILNGAMYSLIFFSALRVVNFTIKNSNWLNYNTSLWLLIFLYHISIFAFALVLWLNLSNTKKDEKHLAIVGAIICVLFIFLWIKGYKVYTMTCISMIVPLVPYMNIPELLLKAKSRLDEAQSNMQQSEEKQLDTETIE